MRTEETRAILNNWQILNDLMREGLNSESVIKYTPEINNMYDKLRNHSSMYRLFVEDGIKPRDENEQQILEICQKYSNLISTIGSTGVNGFSKLYSNGIQGVIESFGTNEKAFSDFVEFGGMEEFKKKQLIEKFSPVYEKTLNQYAQFKPEEIK